MKLRESFQRIKQEIGFYRNLIADPQTPPVARWLLIAALAYLASPIDLIPDFIPIVGQFDDVIVVGALVLLARALIPKTVLIRHRRPNPATVVTLSNCNRD